MKSKTEYFGPRFAAIMGISFKTLACICLYISGIKTMTRDTTTTKVVACALTNKVSLYNFFSVDLNFGQILLNYLSSRNKKNLLTYPDVDFGEDGGGGKFRLGASTSVGIPSLKEEK